MEYQDTASSLDRKFTFSESELAAVRTALKTKLYDSSESTEVRQAKWKALLSALCTAFDIEVVGLEFEKGGDADKPGYGTYCPDSKVITIGSRYSLVTLLHFFSIALLHAKQTDPEFVAMMQSAGFQAGWEFGGAFSLSFFREAAPKMFEKAKLEGKLLIPEQMEAAGRQGERRPAPEDDERPEPRPGSTLPDIDPENRVDRGNGFGED